MITALLVMLTAGSAMCATYDSSVTLENKNSAWDIVGDDGISATIDFNASGEKFEWHAYGVAPMPETEYSLIYYADYTGDRFGDWGGDNPGAFIGAFMTAEPNGVVGGTFDATGSIDLDMNLPCSPDANMAEHDYSGEPDFYAHAHGAKLWMVPSDDYDVGLKKVIAYNPANYLFETDLIEYDDTNIAPVVEETWATWDDIYQAGDTMEITARVRDNDGIEDIESVTINLTEYGVEGITILELGEEIDAMSANYSTSVVMTVATYGEVCENVVATDQTELIGFRSICFNVKHDDAHKLIIEGPDEVLSLTYGCFNLDTGYMFWDLENAEHYAALMTVILVDKFGNQVYDTNCVMGVTAEAYVSHLSGSGCYPWEGFIAAGGLFSQPCTSTFTARCLDDTSILWGYHTVEFLPSVYDIGVTLDNSTMYYDNGSADCTTVYAQLIDDKGNPIAMPGISVEFYHGDGDSDKVVFDPSNGVTDDNGVANTTVCVVTDTNCTAKIYAGAECRAGNTTLDIVEPVLDHVDIVDTWSPMTSGRENQTFVCVGYTDHDTMMCCPCDGIWTATLGKINDTTGYFVAGEYEGVAEITVNVSGVFDTEDIVINAKTNCSEDIEAGVEFTLTSGTVSITGNYSDDDGYACVQALGDPIEDWSNDTKGAEVDASENVTLDLNGTGDMWMLNGSDWEEYATGDTAEVETGTYALVYDEPAPDPDPEPTPTATRRSSSGGGGYYPPTPTPTPEVGNATDNETDQDDPSSSDTKPADAKPTVNLPGDDKTLDTTPDDKDKSSGGYDPTNAILLVLALLAVCVIGYVIYQKSQR